MILGGLKSWPHGGEFFQQSDGFILRTRPGIDCCCRSCGTYPAHSVAGWRHQLKSFAGRGNGTFPLPKERESLGGQQLQKPRVPLRLLLVRDEIEHGAALRGRGR